MKEWLVAKKDGITSIMAGIIVVAGAIEAYLKSTANESLDPLMLAFVVVSAIIGWFTGKNSTPPA